MTDPEISKALALAIGWTKADLLLYPEHLVILPLMRRFDYRDWNVIGPIAEKYDLFPCQWDETGPKKWMTFCNTVNAVFADTPQRAIALAVIEGVKK